MSTDAREPLVWPYDDAPFDAAQVRELLAENERLRAALTQETRVSLDFQQQRDALRAEVAALSFSPGTYTCGCKALKVTDMVEGFCPTHLKPLKGD